MTKDLRELKSLLKRFAKNQNQRQRQGRRVIAEIGEIYDLTDINQVPENEGALLKNIPIAYLEEIRQHLKYRLGDAYKDVRIRYRGPRPALRYTPDEENFLKIVRAGASVYRSRYDRASDCLAHQANRFSIYLS